MKALLYSESCEFYLSDSVLEELDDDLIVEWKYREIDLIVPSLFLEKSKYDDLIWAYISFYYNNKLIVRECWLSYLIIDEKEVKDYTIKDIIM